MLVLNVPKWRFTTNQKKKTYIVTFMYVFHSWLAARSALRRPACATRFVFPPRAETNAFAIHPFGYPDPLSSFSCTAFCFIHVYINVFFPVPFIIFFVPSLRARVNIISLVQVTLL